MIVDNTEVSVEDFYLELPLSNAEVHLQPTLSPMPRVNSTAAVFFVFPNISDHILLLLLVQDLPLNLGGCDKDSVLLYHFP